MSEHPSTEPPTTVERCPVCDRPEMVRLVDNWQQEGRIPIIGCGNPWHYDGLYDARAEAAQAAPPPLSAPEDVNRHWLNLSWVPETWYDRICATCGHTEVNHHGDHTRCFVRKASSKCRCRGYESIAARLGAAPEDVATEPTCEKYIEAGAAQGAAPDQNHSRTGTVQAIMAEHRQCGPRFDGCYSHWPTPHCRADGMAWPCDVDAIRAAIGPHTHAPGETDKRCAKCYRASEDFQRFLHPEGAAPRAEGLDVERLADLEHEQWAHWTRFMLDNLTPENIERWRRQIDTPYADLSEKERESDREWARKALAALSRPSDDPEDGIGKPRHSGPPYNDEGIPM